MFTRPTTRGVQRRGGWDGRGGGTWEACFPAFGWAGAAAAIIGMTADSVPFFCRRDRQSCLVSMSAAGEFNGERPWRASPNWRAGPGQAS